MLLWVWGRNESRDGRGDWECRRIGPIYIRELGGGRVVQS